MPALHTHVSRTCANIASIYAFMLMVYKAVLCIYYSWPGLRVVGGNLALQGLHSRSLYYSWCVLLACCRSPIMQCIHLLVFHTFWALEVACLLALSRPSAMAVNTARSLLSITPDTVVQREPSCSNDVFASGARVSSGSPVFISISH